MSGAGPTRILLAGGTGLIGRSVARNLAARGDVELISLTRREPGSAGETRIDFERLVAKPVGTLTVARAEVGVCCLGTTLRTAGSPEAFRRVDHDYVLAFAKAARAAGATRFAMVSSVGAGGRGLYLRTKGDAEREVAELGFSRLDILRPGLLVGARKERRVGERIAQVLAPMVDPLLIGGLARYASIRSDVVAAAVEQLALETAPGLFVHHGPELRRLALRP